ncbi:hypothetical protein IWZ00DRAFT_544131 [Phyllosticta capitalensis]
MRVRLEFVESILNSRELPNTRHVHRNTTTAAPEQPGTHDEKRAHPLNRSTDDDTAAGFTIDEAAPHCNTTTTTPKQPGTHDEKRAHPLDRSTDNDTPAGLAIEKTASRHNMTSADHEDTEMDDEKRAPPLDRTTNIDTQAGLTVEKTTSRHSMVSADHEDTDMDDEKRAPPLDRTTDDDTAAPEPNPRKHSIKFVYLDDEELCAIHAQSQRSELQHVKRLVVLAFQRIDTIEDEKKSLEEQVERLECRVDQLSSAACKSQRTQMQDDGRAETELQCVKGPMGAVTPTRELTCPSPTASCRSSPRRSQRRLGSSPNFFESPPDNYMPPRSPHLVVQGWRQDEPSPEGSLRRMGLISKLKRKRLSYPKQEIGHEGLDASRKSVASPFRGSPIRGADSSPSRDNSDALLAYNGHHNGFLARDAVLRAHEEKRSSFALNSEDGSVDGEEQDTPVKKRTRRE